MIRRRAIKDNFGWQFSGYFGIFFCDFWEKSLFLGPKRIVDIKDPRKNAKKQGIFRDFLAKVGHFFELFGIFAWFLSTF